MRVACMHELMETSTFIQMFNGIDGFRLGLERSGWKCVWSNDNDKCACQISKKNYPNGVLIEGDIREVEADTIPEHTLLTAGFPCPTFSLAGKRKGFKDNRGTLYLDIARIAKVKRPPLLLLENVKGLLSHDEGLTFQIIIESLENLGYLVEWQVLNSKHFGVPQNRERVFIVGHLRGKGSNQIFPIGESIKEPSKMEEREQASAAIDRSYYKGYDHKRQLIRVGGLWDRRGRTHPAGSFYNPNGISPSLETAKGGYREPMIVLEHACTPFYPMSNRQQVVVEHKKITERSGEYGSGFKQNETFCLDSSVGRDQILHIEDMQIRRLTPTECERLQGFPDGWTKIGTEENVTENRLIRRRFMVSVRKDFRNGLMSKKDFLNVRNWVLELPFPDVPISDKNRYEALGNAVTVNVIEFLGQRLLACMHQGELLR